MRIRSMKVGTRLKDKTGKYHTGYVDKLAAGKNGGRKAALKRQLKVFDTKNELDEDIERIKRDLDDVFKDHKKASGW